jgi:MFS family permease
MAAEAFGWVITSVTVGLAIGQGLSGQLIEHFGTRPAFIASGVAGLLIAAAVWLLRGTVRRGVPRSEEPLPSRAEMDLAAR